MKNATMSVVKFNNEDVIATSYRFRFFNDGILGNANVDGMTKDQLIAEIGETGNGTDITVNYLTNTKSLYHVFAYCDDKGMFINGMYVYDVASKTFNKVQ